MAQPFVGENFLLSSNYSGQTRKIAQVIEERPDGGYLIEDDWGYKRVIYPNRSMVQKTAAWVGMEPA